MDDEAPLLESRRSPKSYGGAARSSKALAETDLNSSTFSNSALSVVQEESGDKSAGFTSVTIDSPIPAHLNIVGLSYVVKERPGHWWNGSCFRAPKKKVVLHNLCMTFPSGELTALVGNSGSGKTSLLDVISGRATGDVTGVVSYKHEQCTRAMMKERSSYVLQADRLLPTLTIRETLTFMAYLKLPGKYKEKDINKKVESVIMDMGLRHVADNQIGGAVVRGVSGGEKRRITIGVQLLRDPEILLLDEPTSGLDAFTARHLVSSLADIAHKGKAVLMSIHQPRSDIFLLLDKLAILTMGQVAYFGSPKQLVPYFTGIGYPCPRDQNPCDVYLDIVSVDRRSASQERSTMKRAQKLCNKFSKSEMQQDIVKRITAGLNYHYSDSLEEQSRMAQPGPSWFRVFFTLMKRMNVHIWRDRGAFLGRLMFLPFFVPFILIFLGRLKNNQGSIQDRLGVIYQSSQVPPYMGLSNCIALFPVLRGVFYREGHDGLYSNATFLLAYWFHCLPFNIVTSIIFVNCLYWIIGFNEDPMAYGLFLFVCTILTQFGETMTVAVLGLFQNVQLANNTTALIFSASGLVASGLVRTVENMPQILKWAGYVAIHKYSTEIIVENEFSGLEFECSAENSTGAQCIKTGDIYLKQNYPDAKDNETRNLIMMGGYSAAILILAWILFKIRGIPTLH